MLAGLGLDERWAHIAIHIFNSKKNFFFWGDRPNVEWCKFVKAHGPKTICLLEVLSSIKICTLLLKESSKKSLLWVPVFFGRCLQLTI